MTATLPDRDQTYLDDYRESPTDEQLCILREQNHELDAAARLVEEATAERREYQARILLEIAQSIVGDIPEAEATDEDLDYVTAAYMTWARACEALHAARNAHTDEEN